jgi:hypothetical protein
MKDFFTFKPKTYFKNNASYSSSLCLLLCSTDCSFAELLFIIVGFLKLALIWPKVFTSMIAMIERKINCVFAFASFLVFYNHEIKFR